MRQGMTVTAGQTLVRINGIGTVWLDAAVPEAQAEQVRLGGNVEARFAAFPGDTFQGRITSVLPALTDATRSLRVRIELPNKGGQLRPGLTARVSLQAATREAVLSVPTEAVIRTGKRALVMVAEEKGRFRPVEVTLGQESGGKTAVLAGLSEGQEVVVSGQFLLDSEASLRGLEASAPGQGGSAVPQAAALHEADATIEEISDSEVTIAHGPFRTLAMPGMTMAFRLARPSLAQGLKVGDRVRVGLRQTDDDFVIEAIHKIGGNK